MRSPTALQYTELLTFDARRRSRLTLSKEEPRGSVFRLQKVLPRTTCQSDRLPLTQGYKGPSDPMLFGLFRVVGLTGGIASGKSTVSAELHDVYGLDIIDADKIARDVLIRGTASFEKVVKAFGPSILGSNGEIDRARLAEIVFSDAAKRTTLNKIVHPAIKYSMAWQTLCHFARGTPMVILDAPLLYETGLNRVTNFVVVVSCTREQQILRFMSRTGSSREHAEKRLEAQKPLEWKVAQAEYVIDNSSSVEDTKEQVKELVQRWNVGPTGWLARIRAFFARFL